MLNLPLPDVELPSSAGSGLGGRGFSLGSWGVAVSPCAIRTERGTSFMNRIDVVKIQIQRTNVSEKWKKLKKSKCLSWPRAFSENEFSATLLNRYFFIYKKNTIGIYVSYSQRRLFFSFSFHILQNAHRFRIRSPIMLSIPNHSIRRR